MTKNATANVFDETLDTATSLGGALRLVAQKYGIGDADVPAFIADVQDAATRVLIRRDIEAETERWSLSENPEYLECLLCSRFFLTEAESAGYFEPGILSLRSKLRVYFAHRVHLASREHRANVRKDREPF